LNEQTLDAYVRAALALQGYEFNETQIELAKLQFARFAEVAQGFLGITLPLESEPAPVYCP
jgi:hypothetical protein